MSETAAPNRRERQLDQRDEPLRLVLEAARVAVWERDLRTGHATWSTHAERLYGLAPGSYDGTWDSFLALIHPDDRARVARALQTAIERASDYQAEYRAIWPDGTVRWILAQGQVVRDLGGTPLRFLGVAQDVTERKYTEEALRRSEERYRTMVQTANEGICVVDASARPLYVNDRMAELLGYPAAEIAERSMFDFCFPDDREWARRRLQRNLRGEAEQFPARFRRRDGSAVHVLACTSPMRGADGAVVGALGLFTDITARRAAEDALRESMEQERAARAEAEAAVRARDEFLAIAAHELLTPVTALKGYTQTLLRAQARGPVEPGRLARVLARLDESCDRLTALTGDLLDVSRLRTGQLTLRPRPLDLAALAAAGAAEYRDQLGESHTLLVEATAGPCPVLADHDRVEQVLRNLLDNAAKYSPAGGAIYLRARPDGDGALLEVQDEGIGLPPGAAETLFEPFGRAPNAARRQIPGMGLGLYVCRQLVEQHGGRMWAASPGEDQGTTVSVWLPAPRAAPR